MAAQWENRYLLFFWIIGKMKKDIVTPSKSFFYKRYVDDTYFRRKKIEIDELYNALNLYDQNIKLTLELDPIKFLDTEIIRSNGKITTHVYNKTKKLPVHWTSKIPVRYKRNAIISELQRAKKIASNSDIEIKRIVNKYTAVGFPNTFVRSIINSFDSGKDNLIIPKWLFEESKENCKKYVEKKRYPELFYWCPWYLLQSVQMR